LGYYRGHGTDAAIFADHFADVETEELMKQRQFDVVPLTNGSVGQGRACPSQAAALPIFAA